MKSLILALALLGASIHPVNAAAVEGPAVLALNSTRFCVGASWNLNLSNAPPSAAIRLFGVVNETPWEIPHWADTDANGNFSSSGTYTVDAAATYTVRAEIMGSMSNALPVEVVKCGWSASGSLGTSRSSHTATLLANGKVLVAGSLVAACFPECRATDRAEIYDPATGQWGVTGSMSTPRFSHIAVRLTNGKVLVAGGFRRKSATTFDTAETSAEIYDPGSGVWSPAGSLRIPRAWHRATLLADGRVLVTGGTSTDREFLSSAELYDPATNAWSLAGTMNSPREMHTATLLPGGKVLVFGGLGGLGAFYYGFPLKSAELYDPTTGSWTPTGSLINGRVLHAATLLHDGKVLVAGGERDDIPFDHYGNGIDKAELYDPATGQWSSTGNLNGPRVFHTMTPLPDGSALVVGGSTEIYAPGSGTWTLLPPSTPTAGSDTSTLLPNGKVLIVAGTSSSLYDGGFEIPLLSMDSTAFCVGAPWELTASRAPRSAPVRLVGASNGTSWEIARWGVADAEGKFRATGNMANGTEGAHRLYVDIGGVWSNEVAFGVSDCKP